MTNCCGWQEVLEEDACRTERFARLQPLQEGLVLTGIRVLWIPFVCIHRPIVVRLILRTLGGMGLLLVNHESWDKKTFKRYLSFIVDVYVVLWTILLVVLYLALTRLS